MADPAEDFARPDPMPTADLVEEAHETNSSGIGFVDDPSRHERTGSVFGMTFNSITNVIGGGVLNFPDAMCQASLSVGIVLMTVFSAGSLFMVDTLVRACDYYEAYTIYHVFALALCPRKSDEELQHLCENAAAYLASHPNALAIPPEPLDVPLHGAPEHVQREGATSLSTTMPVGEVALDELRRELSRTRWRSRAYDMMLVSVFLFNFGCLVLYGVVIGDSLPPVVEDFFGGHGIWVERGTWLLAAGVVFFGLSCVRQMQELMWSSVLGFVTILYVVVVVVVRFFTIRADPSTMPSFNEGTDDVSYFDFSVNWFTAMTTLALAFAYHYNVPAFYGELRVRTHSNMMKTAYYSLPVTIASYMSTAIFGYLTFGAAVDSTYSGGNIVNNFSEDDAAVNVGRFGLFFHFCCVYPILSVSCRRVVHSLLYCYVLQPREAARRSAAAAGGGSAEAPSSVSLLATPAAPKPSDATAPAANETTALLSASAPAPGQASVPSLAGSVDASVPLRLRAVRNGKMETLDTRELFAHLGRDEPPPSLRWIVAEAFVIVSLSILFAWIAPGIKIVVNVSGSLFGLFLMFVAPSIIGAQMYRDKILDLETGTDRGVEDKSFGERYILQASYARKRAICVGIAIVGSVMMVVSFYTSVA